MYNLIEIRSLLACKSFKLWIFSEMLLYNLVAMNILM